MPQLKAYDNGTSAWVPVLGSQGPTGSTGSTGSTGPTGATGDLTAYSTTAQMNTAITAGVGLVPILTQTIGTAVSSVVVSNVFSATYDAYKIVISGGSASVLNENITLILGASVTSYYQMNTGLQFGGTTNASATSNVGSINFGTTLQSNGITGNMDFVNPFLAKYTYFQGARIYTTLANAIAGYHGQTTSYTDFTLTVGSGTLTGGTIRVYGYKN